MPRRKTDAAQGALDLGPSPWPAIRAAFCRRVLDDRAIDVSGMFQVAWAMAEHMNTDTAEARVRQRVLAEEVHRSERHVRRLLGILVDRGHLVVVGTAPNSRTLRYRLARPDEPLAEIPDVPRSFTFSPTGGRKSGFPGGADPAETPPPQAAPYDRFQPAQHDRMVGGANRHSMTASTGPCDPVKEPITEPQSPPCGGYGVPVQDRYDGVSDRDDLAAPPSVADDRAVRRLREAGWRTLLATEPVVAQPDASALHDLLAEGVTTEADVTAGIEAAVAKRDFRPTQWRSLVGWARKATSNRLAATPRPDLPAAAAAGPVGDLWTLEGGVRRTVAALERAVAEWDQGFAWDDHLGFPPDSELTSLPRHLWRSARGRPRLDKRAG